MLGTILIVVLVMALLGVLLGGPIAETGVMPRRGEWGWSWSLSLCSCCSVASRARRPTTYRFGSLCAGGPARASALNQGRLAREPSPFLFFKL